MMEAIVAGAVAGLIAWGGIRVELRWLRSDVERVTLRTHQHAGELQQHETRITVLERTK